MFLVKINNESGRPDEAAINVKQVASVDAALDIVNKDMDFDQAKEDMIEGGPAWIQVSPIIEWEGSTTILVATNGSCTFAYLVK